MPNNFQSCIIRSTRAHSSQINCIFFFCLSSSSSSSSKFFIYCFHILCVLSNKVILIHSMHVGSVGMFFGCLAEQEACIPSISIVDLCIWMRQITLNGGYKKKKKNTLKKQLLSLVSRKLWKIFLKFLQQNCRKLFIKPSWPHFIRRRKKWDSNEYFGRKKKNLSTPTSLYILDHSIDDILFLE